MFSYFGYGKVISAVCPVVVLFFGCTLPIRAESRKISCGVKPAFFSQLSKSDGQKFSITCSSGKGKGRNAAAHFRTAIVTQTLTSQMPWPTQAEPSNKWAQKKFEKNELADFAEQCGRESSELSLSDAEDGVSCSGRCGEVDGKWLRDILTRKEAPYGGVHIQHARVCGSLNLEGAKLIRPFKIAASTFVDEVNLSHAHSDSFISFESSRFLRGLEVVGLHVESDFDLNGAILNNYFNAATANIDGSFILNNIKIIRHINKQYLGRVAEVPFFTLKGNNELLEQSALIEQSAPNSFKGRQLSASNFTGLQTASHSVGFSKEGGENKAAYKSPEQLNLQLAIIKGQLNLTDAKIEVPLFGESLEVGDVFLNNALLSDTNFVMAHIGGSLELNSVTINCIDLSSATIDKEFKLTTNGTEEDKNLKRWRGCQQKTPFAMKLHYAHVDRLVDMKEAWPEPNMLLHEGFTFNHWGGFASSAQPDLLGQRGDWWDNWARAPGDDSFSLTPYTQLAAAFASAGDNDSADRIRYLSKERSRQYACSGWKRPGVCVFLTLWWAFAAYSIGYYGFSVILGSLALFALIGGVILWTSAPQAAEKGFWWCLRASLVQIVPYFEVDEFKEFLKQPAKIAGKWMRTIFHSLKYVGWILLLLLGVVFKGLIA